MSSQSTDIPVLLTSSVVAHDPGVALTDTDERLQLALESIEQWLKIDPGLPLVLCDGSSHDFSQLVRQRFPDARIECLAFENDQEKVRLFGRGYGEGEIVRHALDHSRFIATAGCFAKCSSKLWVENFQQCTSDWNQRFLCKGVFLDVFSPIRKTTFSYIDTRFYVASVSFYRQHFENAHLQVGMRNGKAFSLEDCFHDVVLKDELKGILMRVPPVISGAGGGIGKYYRNTRTRQFKENLRLKLVRMNPAFRDLFA